MFSQEKAMQTVSTPGSGKTALLFGALFGIASGLIQILCIFSLAGAGFLLSLVLCAIVLLFAGLFASRRTGKVSTGTLAGLWCGLVSSVIVVGILGLILLFVTHNPTYMDEFMNGMRSSNLPSSITPQQMVLYMGLGMVILGVVWLAVGIGAGAGIGAIGGLIGKSMSPAAQYVQQPFTSYPAAPNYPQYSMPPTPTPPGQFPYPMNGAPVPPASQQQQSNLPYPPPPSYYHEPADQSSSADVRNPYTDSQQPPYLSSDQQQ
jgi:hypothetical protein